MRGAIDCSDGGVMQQIKPQRLLVCMQLLVMVAIAPPTQPINAPSGLQLQPVMEFHPAR